MRIARPVLRLAVALVAAASLPATAAAQNVGGGLRNSPDEARTNVGTRGAAFLSIPVGARANALAGAGTVAAEGVEALFWNPAGTAYLEGLAGSISYSEVFAGSGIEHFFIGAAMPLLGGVLGAAVNSLSSGDIPRTREQTPSGDNPGVGNTFDWTSTAVSIGYSRLITDRLAAGLTGKYITEGIQNARAEWPALDVGVRFTTGLYGTVIGASIVNIGGQARMNGSAIEESATAAAEVLETERTIDVSLDTRANALPTAFQFGVALDLTGVAHALTMPGSRHRATVIADIRDAQDTDIQPTFAVEYSFAEMAFARLGKRWFNESDAEWDFADGLSAGLGLRVPLFGSSVSIDYAYTSLGILEHRQVFTFGFGF